MTATATALSSIAPSLVADHDLCTLNTCPLSLAHVDYRPSIPGNALYLVIFTLALLFQVFFGIKYKTWGYLVAMIGGLVLEIIGYVGRLQLHDNPFKKSYFLEYLICLTIGPAFLSAAIYLCLSRIVTAYSARISAIKPQNYTYIFIACDFLALLLQAAGGALASGADDPKKEDTGRNIMVAGVSWQVFSLLLFAGLCYEYCLRVRRAFADDLNPGFEALRRTWRFKWFLRALALATLTIFVRSVFRCAELSQGFHGKLANQQVTYMILEGAMICIAVICLTAFHPGLVFKGDWKKASWSKDKGTKETWEMGTKGNGHVKVESFESSAEAINQV